MAVLESPQVQQAYGLQFDFCFGQGGPSAVFGCSFAIEQLELLAQDFWAQRVPPKKGHKKEKGLGTGSHTPTCSREEFFFVPKEMRATKQRPKW